MSNPSAGVVFDALGEPVRRQILRALRHGPLAVGQLASVLPVGRPAVSKHLRVLGEAGLVEREQRGTRNLYALAPPGLVAAQQWLVETWDIALNRYAVATADAAAEYDLLIPGDDAEGESRVPGGAADGPGPVGR